MTVYVDSREPKQSQERARRFLNSLGGVVVETLPVGDFVCGNVVIERKTIKDFFGSYKKGRLQNQITHMKANFDHVFVIITGPEWIIEEETGWTVNSFHGIMMELAMDYGIHVMRADSENGLMIQARTAFKRANVNVDYVERGLKRVAPRTDDKYVNMVCEVDGIGEKKARAILKIFKVKELFYCSKKDLMGIDGIGPKQAEKIKEVFH